MAVLSVDAGSIARFVSTTSEIGERASDLRPVWPGVVDDFRAVQARRFSGGAGWPADTSAWQARKAREGKGNRTLIYTGTLERSLTRQGRYSLERRGKTELRVGTRDPVANLLAAGARGAPPRPPVGWDDADEGRWVDAMGRWVLLGRASQGL